MCRVCDLFVAEQGAEERRCAVCRIVGIELALKEACEGLDELKALDIRQIALQARRVNRKRPIVLYVDNERILCKHLLICLDRGAHDNCLRDTDIFFKVCALLVVELCQDAVSEDISRLLPVFTSNDIELAAKLCLCLDTACHQRSNVAKVLTADRAEYRICLGNRLCDALRVGEADRADTLYRAGLLGIAKDVDKVRATLIDEIDKTVGLLNKGERNAAQIQQMADKAAGDLARTKYDTTHNIYLFLILKL